MKKSMSAFMSVVLTFMLVAACAFTVPTTSEAAETTFSGTVSDQTTSDVLYLSTSGGTMEIKIDSSTSLSGSKLILPGCTVSASCTRGSDEYWHATTITGTAQVGNVTVDSSNSSTVKGTIAKGTSEDLLYLVVDTGTMQIKMDDSTDLSGVTMLIIGKTVKVVCARGSDAYMHALSISDVESSTSSTSTSTSSSSTSSGTSVKGTVEKGTTSSVLYLETSAGTMEFVLDLATDASACRTLIPGNSITVTFYRGTDAWNHTSKLVNNSSSASDEVSLDESTKTTVTGDVESKTTEDTLYLDTNGGTMQIKLDDATNFSKCPVIIQDKSIQVVIERGSDEYYHAVSIEAD